MATVSYTAETLATLRVWGEEAERVGLGTQFTAALRQLDQRLRSDPELWGDPLWDYRQLHLTYYQRYGAVFIVRYSVHIDGTNVFVHEIRLTPGSPLFERLE